MPKRTVFLECMTAKPLALCRADGARLGGSNPGAHALAIRSAPGGEQQQQPSASETDMDKKDLFRAVSALALMDEVTRAYFAGLDEDKGTAFLERTADEQRKEAHDAKNAADAERARTEALASGATEREIALEREVAELRAKDVARDAAEAERKLIDLSRSKDFDGFPGGEEKVLETLRSIAALTPAQQEPTLALMRAQASQARTTAQLIGTPQRTAEEMPATTRVQTEAERRAKEGGISVERAMLQMSREPAWQADLERADEEQRAA